MGRRLARDMLVTCIVALIIHLGFMAVGAVSMRPDAYDLRPRGLANVVEFLLLLLIFELPVVCARFAFLSFENPEIRKSLRMTVGLVTILFLSIGFWHVKLTRFESVHVDAGAVTIEGNNWLASHRFKLNKIDEVVLVRNNFYDELLFRLFDRIHASVFMLRFDTVTRHNLDALLKDLKRRGIDSKVELRR